MEQITLRLDDDLKDELETEADERGVSRSEHIRNVLETRADTERLRDRLETREERIDELEEQLARRSQLEQKVENLPEKVRETESYQDRRQRALDTAGPLTRLKWRVTGVPADAVDPDDSNTDR